MVGYRTDRCVLRLLAVFQGWEGSPLVAMQPGTMAPDIHGEVPCAICSRTMSNGGDPITPASPGNEDAKQKRKRHWCVPVCAVLGVIAFFTWALFIINYVLFPE